MAVRNLTPADPTTMTALIGSTKDPGPVSATRPQQPAPLQSFPGDQNYLANYIAANSYQGNRAPNPPVLTAGPDYTFGPEDTPAYNPVIDQLGTSPTSDNGQVAANALLRMEQSSIAGPFGVADEAQFVTQQLATHKNDPLFLQQYFGTLGPKRTADIFRYLTSVGHVRTPNSFAGTTADAAQLKRQEQDLADALSTMVKSKDLSQNDMDRLVADFAKDSPEDNFTFAKDVLGKASPAVNQMFYNSAKNYALGHPDSSAGQAMAAYAMQALSQTSNPMTELANMPKDQLSSLIKAAMQGEARYGNPPSLEDLASGEPGKGDPLDGLSRLMFDSAYSDVGDQFAPAPLTAGQAQSLQTRLFQTATDVLENNPSAKAYYQTDVGMKDALGAIFQQDYPGLVQSYLGPNGPNGQPNYDLSPQGVQAFQQFFGDAVFTPPPGSNGAATANFFMNQVTSFVHDSGTLTDGQFKAKYNYTKEQYAALIGDQAYAFAGGLAQGLASARSDSDKKALTDMVGALLTVGEASATVIGPEGTVLARTIGGAIVGEALKLLLSSGGGNDAQQKAIQDLKDHGVDVTKYQVQDTTAQIFNYGHPDDTLVRTNFNDRLHNG